MPATSCRAICEKCRRTIPYANAKAATSAMRRHRERYHKGEKGPLRYTLITVQVFGTKEGHPSVLTTEYVGAKESDGVPK